MVAIESTVQVPGAGNVQTRLFDFKDATGLSGR
jgi:hypothetical protein